MFPLLFALGGFTMSVPMPMPRPVSRLRSPVGPVRAAAALLGIVIAADLFAVHAGLALYDVTGDLMNGATGGAVLRRADAAESLDSLALKVHSGSMLVCVIVYVSWFAPGLNFWYPRRITLEVWDASSPAGIRRPHLLVNAWWTLWLLAILVVLRLTRMQHEKAPARAGVPVEA